MESPANPRKTGPLLASLILMAMCLTLLGITLWLSQAKKQWQHDDVQLARSVYVKWIDVEPGSSGDNSNLLLKVCNSSAAECGHFTIELQWSGEGGLQGVERKDFTQTLARGQEVTLPPWACLVKAGPTLALSARVIPATKA